jgi:hypothetical protein
MKKCIIVHGWGGSPTTNWIPAMKKAVEAKGYEVEVPEMPDTENPVISAWLKKLQEVAVDPDSETVFIGHSIGCQAILRFLEKLTSGTKINRCIFFAPWITLKGLETDDEREIAKPWLETPIDFEKVKSHCDVFTAFFSDDDPFVPVEDKKVFEEKLHAETHLEHKKGHFDNLDVQNYPLVVKIK